MDDLKPVLTENVDGESPHASETSPVQAGIQNIEALTTVWSRNALVLAYVLIWLTFLVEGLLSGVQASLIPYVTSSFSQHSLIPTISVLSSIIGGCTSFAIAKILDVFGRPQGYLLCVLIATSGLVMMAACQTVEVYAAAQIFYTVGNTGLQYTLNVFVADTSSLRNRGLMVAFSTSPYIITCWLGGPISTSFLDGSGWPWAFGTFAILVPAVALPLYTLLQYNMAKAKKLNIIPASPIEQSSWAESIVHYCREFDIIGVILLSAGVALILLPFNLYTMQPSGWASPLVICLLVFGCLLCGIFVIWERSFAPVTFIPYSMITERTVLGACLLSATLFFTYFCWSSYFSSFLQVVNNLSVTDANYVVQVYTAGFGLFALAAGYVIRRTGRFKYFCLYGGIPLNILGTGLLIYFRTPNSHIGYIIMCQILITIASGIVMIADEIAILAAVAHQQVAVAFAIVSFFGNVGSAIALTVSSAIWQNVLPAKLALYLPAEELPNLVAIYSDITVQLSYPVGSDARTAIQHAYGDAQTAILIVATVAWLFGVAAVLLFRDIDVSEVKQVKGNVV
ncbi:hypothetical protein HDU93_008211 [Gonapodya sp. JEL0774]|nr:hypothetical protein HDU93_008211 [Gonapodya sp. JEL0774]